MNKNNDNSNSFAFLDMDEEKKRRRNKKIKNRLWIIYSFIIGANLIAIFLLMGFNILEHKPILSLDSIFTYTFIIIFTILYIAFGFWQLKRNMIKKKKL